MNANEAKIEQQQQNEIMKQEKSDFPPKKKRVLNFFPSETKLFLVISVVNNATMIGGQKTDCERSDEVK